MREHLDIHFSKFRFIVPFRADEFWRCLVFLEISLVEKIKKSSWIQYAVKEGRFHNWVLHARYWVVFRDRC
ncbi:predicted protein [Chaetoceros tenuissimus]|uniref:Uncharacterized protein n=1 Tax=Chaetoceros tenuissimus TaxID=426638 RepID=A0AAD3GYS8_9STRA|nr:predicted protein [Chaetoceros tenuissimus]